MESCSSYLPPATVVAGKNKLGLLKFATLADLQKALVLQVREHVRHATLEGKALLTEQGIQVSLSISPCTRQSSFRPVLLLRNFGTAPFWRLAVKYLQFHGHFEWVAEIKPSGETVIKLELILANCKNLGNIVAKPITVNGNCNLLPFVATSVVNVTIFLP